MTDSTGPRRLDQKFLQELLRALGLNPKTQVDEYEVQPDGTIKRLPDRSNKSVMRLIHDRVDIDFIKALQQWVVSQKGNEKGEYDPRDVCANLAFYIANELYNVCKDEAEVCSVSCDYGEYIHQSTHVMYKKYGAPKPDVEK